MATSLKARILATVAVAGFLTFSAPAFAAPTPWVHPGTHPYEGTPQEAGALHEKAIGLPVSEFMKGVELFNAGRCEEVFLPDGTVLQNTFTKAGVSRSVSTVVAFKDVKTGRTLAPNDPKRRAARCRIPGRTDGATVVFPYVCRNWSVQYLWPTAQIQYTPPPPQAEPVPEVRDYSANTTHDVISGDYPDISIVVVSTANSSSSSSSSGSSGSSGHGHGHKGN